ncbi:unnamed protein product (macronuclear) [Paramecium tetraurelia]|uniref:Protein kinase domain-containing protein n=1 Tax=Paramecium tetraurelia TaxID=5888 RepID=A0DSA0_PARTE|nr:uncharacterized protein GSPATT00019621001 [Paramecium tetraurelia]CAK85917.1 unnamed protein product [Paramecium tetraurelia]|eukprot:XP_001453314.1 hypothetical protein (macronuclear) [Paramecium tetraurelia strain d4-2]
MHQRVLTNESPYHRQIYRRPRLQSQDPGRRVLTETDTKTNISRKFTKFDFDSVLTIRTSKGSKKFKPQRFEAKPIKTEVDSDLETYQRMVLAKMKEKNILPKQRSLSNATPQQKSQDRYASLDSQNRINNKQTQNVHPKILWDMSEEEWQQFGDRFPQHFEKKKLLGRGGFSLVWLGEHKRTKEKFAIKQILSTNTHQSHMKEIWFGIHFFQDGQPKQQFTSFPGSKNLVRFLTYDIKPQDTWIFQEICGESLGNQLYDLKGKNINNERMYKLTHKPLYNTFRKDLTELKKLIRELAQALDLLQDQRIVHSDLKTENILVKKIKNENDLHELTQVKLIDYGSSFPFDDLKQFSMATPEYMCPEILNYILYENQMNYRPCLMKYLRNYKKPWVIDVWSLGCVVLEIISGIPLWMSLKTIVTKNGKEVIDYGLFAVKGRVFDKIIDRQMEVIQNLDSYIDKNYSGLKIDNQTRFILKEMLNLDPEKRLSPKQIVEYLSTKKEHLITQ